MYEALYDENATEDEILDAYQELVNNGMAWRLEGTVGRTAMDLIDSFKIGLGEEGHYDYYGNYVPSRYDVEEGTKGAAEFARF